MHCNWRFAVLLLANSELNTRNFAELLGLAVLLQVAERLQWDASNTLLLLLLIFTGLLRRCSLPWVVASATGKATLLSWGMTSLPSSPPCSLGCPGSLTGSTVPLQIRCFGLAAVWVWEAAVVQPSGNCLSAAL
jgi:hypothetical protein